LLEKHPSFCWTRASSTSVQTSYRPLSQKRSKPSLIWQFRRCCRHRRISFIRFRCLLEPTSLWSQLKDRPTQNYTMASPSNTIWRSTNLTFWSTMRLTESGGIPKPLISHSWGTQSLACLLIFASKIRTFPKSTSRRSSRWSTVATLSSLKRVSAPCWSA
jgi:hypothetical protein